MKILLIALFLFYSTHVYSTPMRYVLCIDGGGSKTAMQVVDARGVLCSLIKSGSITYTVEASASNINNVGITGVRQTLSGLFDNVVLEKEGVLLRDLLPVCYVFAGIAGLGNAENKALVTSLFEEYGVPKEHLLLTHDASASLQLVRGDGAIIIAGTGSICFGKKGNKRYRVGGLGYLLGNEASGYTIGLQALKVGLAYEYGWGMPTSLTGELCKCYGVQQLKDAMFAFYQGKITPTHIARTIFTVIAQAKAEDRQAINILTTARDELADMVTTMLSISDLSDCEFHLWGGVFKSDIADAFIAYVESLPMVQQRQIRLINRAREEVATLFVQQYVGQGFESLDAAWHAMQHVQF